MSKPFFSLVTPVYNIERLLPKTIDSALLQTFKDWEMVLVDDGSPDNAGKICDEYALKDKRIKVIHKKNEGLAEARNSGIKEITGKYFIILEGSDVFPDKNTLKEIYNDLINNDVDIYFGLLQDVLEKGNEIVNVQKKYSVSGLFLDGGKKLFERLYDNNEILALSSPVNKVFKTNFVVKNNLWFCKGIYHDDDEWLPRTIVLSNKSFFTDKIIYNAMTWDGCLGQNFSEKGVTKKSCDKMFLAKRCIDDIDIRFPSHEEFKPKFYEYYIRIYMSGILDLSYIKDKDFIEQINQSIAKNKSVLNVANKTKSKNLKILYYIYKFLGINVAKKFILKRYSK